MAKFSIGGDEDGAGTSSSPRRKRPRISGSDRSPPNHETHQPQEEDQHVDYYSEMVEVAEGQSEGVRIEPYVEDGLYSDGSEYSSEIMVVRRKPKTVRLIRSSPLSLTDPEVLDCPICFETLTIPVFQCENGHVTCSSCSTKIRNKCPSCSMPIGYNRCRAIERVLDSVRLECQNRRYGCKETVSFASKKEHEMTCIYSPCSCPRPDCRFSSSSKRLYQHFSREHKNYAKCFQYNCTFSVTLNFEEKFIFLQEQNDGVLFILYNEAELIGNLLILSCIWPSSVTEFCCDIVAKIEGTSLQFQSIIEGTQALVNDPSSKRSVIIPTEFFYRGQVKLYICIRHQGVGHVSTLSSTIVA